MCKAKARALERVAGAADIGTSGDLHARQLCFDSSYGNLRLLGIVSLNRFRDHRSQSRCTGADKVVQFSLHEDAQLEVHFVREEQLAHGCVEGRLRSRKRVHCEWSDFALERASEDPARDGQQPQNRWSALGAGRFGELPQHVAICGCQFGHGFLARVLAPILLAIVKIGSNGMYAMLLIAVLMVLGQSHIRHRIAHRCRESLAVAYSKKRVQGAGGSACHSGPMALDKLQPGWITECDVRARLLRLCHHALSRNHLLTEYRVRSDDQAGEQCSGRSGR
mmetsp:Transcript_8305/g.27434  ORF Transcript_8305/g.27434 Transcript_8305/m.27434 type:complete len:279 (+) Transcript_8305:187-1023(+)